MEKLCENHTLMKVSHKKIGGLKSRKDLQGKVEQAHGVTNSKLLTVKLDYLKNEALSKSHAIHTKLDKDLAAMSQPWIDGGFRIYANVKLQKAQDLVNQAIIDDEKAVEDYIAGYDAHVDEQRAELGSAFNEEDYPSKDELRSKSSIKYELAPVPDPEMDARAGMTQAMHERYTAQIVKQEREKVAACVIDLRDRLGDVVKSFRDAMDGYTGERKGRFNDTIVSNIRDLVRNIPDFNLGNDPLIEEVRRDLLSEITSLNPKSLRADEQLRKAAVKAADDITKKIGAFGASKRD